MNYLPLGGGPMWEGVQEVMSGSASIFDLDFKAKVQAVNPWDAIVGAGLETGKHTGMMIDVGCGEHKSPLPAGA